MANPNLDQHTHGFFEDDNADPDSCTQIGVDNSVSESWDMDTNLMVRTGLDEDNNRSGTPFLGFEYQVNGIGGAWTLIETDSVGVKYSDGTPAESAITDTQLLDSGVEGIFADGFYKDSGISGEEYAIDKEVFFELQICVQLLSTDLSDSDVVYFRAVRTANDVVDFTYPATAGEYPQITAVAGGPTTEYGTPDDGVKWGDEVSRLKV